MATSSPAILVLAFFIVFSISSVDVALATRKLLAPTFPGLPNFPYVPLPPFPPGTPLYPEYRLPPPITANPIVPYFPTVPIFSPAVTTTTP